jgi:putative tricarboxylic transport membrane protein
MIERGKNFLQGEVLAGLLLAGLGIYILFQALRLEYTSDFGPGPGFLPFWLGVVIISFSTLVIFVTLRSSNPRKTPSDEETKQPSRSLLSWFALMLGIALLPWLGFYISFAMLAAFLVLAMERRSVAVAIAIGLGSALVFYLIFSLALGVPLPSSPWGL